MPASMRPPILARMTPARAVSVVRVRRLSGGLGVQFGLPGHISSALGRMPPRALRPQCNSPLDEVSWKISVGVPFSPTDAHEFIV
jgi:hypothetical protein